MQHLGKALCGGLTMALLVLQGCGTDAGEQAADAAGAMDAQHAEGSGNGAVHWSYEGDTGAGNWGSLDPSFAVCESGVRQSPVDIAGAAASGEGELEVMWEPFSAEVVDNGHTIQVNVGEGSSMTLEGRQFSLLQFHFHLPSEHTVDAGAFPMEVHFVHQAEEGDLGVIGVFMEAGEPNAAIATVWEAIPGAGESPVMLDAFDATALLPDGASHFRYPGSLTTPPCSEIVSWVVMTESISVSDEQIDAFRGLYSMNARPVQALNERVVQLRGD